MIEVEITNLKELQANLEKYPVISAKHTNQAIELSIVRLRRDVDPVSPQKTGRLKGSWNVGYNMQELSGSLRNLMPYAPYVEFGTRYITPRLFLTGTVERDEQIIDKYFSDALENIINEI